MPHLNIYDSSNSRISAMANMHWERTKIGVANEAEFRSALEGLVADNSSFELITFTGHGSPNTLMFGESRIQDLWFGQRRGEFSSIAKNDALIRFEGCNVAAGNLGWSFLEKTAGAFLLSGGGRVEGETTTVHNLLAPIWVPFGVSFTIGGSTRSVICSAGGGSMTRVGE